MKKRYHGYRRPVRYPRIRIQVLDSRGFRAALRLGEDSIDVGGEVMRVLSVRGNVLVVARGTKHD